MIELHSQFLQMWQRKLPLLTKGPFALYYGGDAIIIHLSNKSPGRGVPVAIFLSALFQICLYIMKLVKSTNIKLYAQNLAKSLVENILNIYGIFLIILMTLLSVAYITIHHWSIERNKEKKKTEGEIPREIFVLYGLTPLCAILPFVKSYALR